MNPAKQRRDPRGSILRLLAVTRKELKHIGRDWQTLMIVIAMPLVMMFLYGFALTMDLREVRCVVEDRECSAVTQRIVAGIDAGTLLSVVTVVHSATADVDALLSQQDAKLLIRLPADLSRRLAALERVDAGLVIDGSDPNMGTILRSAVPLLLRQAILSSAGIATVSPLDIRVQFLYNERQKSALFFVPGLMAVILVMISALLTSLAITREKETGTLEQLLVSPLHPAEIILGKLVPYAVLAAFDGLLIMLAGWACFEVVPQGSLVLLAGASVVYIVASLAIGLVISTLASTQRQAMLMVLPATMLPTIILSGFIFPLSSMPLALQIFAHILPATYYLDIIRGIILKGATFTVVAANIGALCLISTILLVVAVRKFRSQL